MTEYIKFKKSNCRNCYKCIRHCPVKSIRFSGNQAHIVENECILCGQCFVVCPQDAKFIRNDIDRAKVLLASGAKVIASVAPSFIANYDLPFASIKAALKKLGFYDAEETAIGATIVKRQYEKLVREGNGEAIISSCCHSANVLIQKYYPEALRNLARVITPMQAHCESIKARMPEAKTIFIGPCISKKAEAEKYAGAVDCVLTFEELSDWLAQEKIQIEPIAEDNDVNTRARFFPTVGGIIKTMEWEDGNDYEYIGVDGVDNCVAALEDIISGKISRCFVEISICKGSCIGGPVMDKGYNPLQDYLKAARYAGTRDFDAPSVDEQKLSRNHSFIGINRSIPGTDEIQQIFKKMGKTKPEHVLNCGTCGYNTCREKAIAVYQGKADLSMCLPFLKDKAESFSDNIIKNTPNAIIVINESLEVQQINEAALTMMNIRSASDVLGEQVIRILDPTDFFEVMESGCNVHDRHVYLAEYKKYVEQTILYDKEYHIFICIMRDVTDLEAQRDHKEKLSRQTIEIADQVAEKQMRVVQEIAFLLGETTAETKIALAKLKESLQ